MNLNCVLRICALTKFVSVATWSADSFEAWYQITIPPCSRLWTAAGSGTALVYTPQFIGAMGGWFQWGPDVAGVEL